MKRIAVLLSVMVCAVASAWADVVTADRALAIAEEFLGESLSTATEAPRVRGMNRTVEAKPDEAAPLYVISRGDDKGYILVAGDDCLPAVIGYTDSGNFDENDMSPAFRDMLDCVAAVAEAGRAQGAGPRIPGRAPSNWKYIAPLMTSHWNQGAPWNRLCPICKDNGEHAVVGCVATAASQEIYYFRKDLPHQLLAKTPTYKGGDEQCDVTVSYPKGTPIEYDLMFDSYNNSEPDYLKDAVALLCFTIGSAARLGYWHSTGGYIGEANKAMKTHFGLTGTDLSRNEMDIRDWENIIYNSLAASKPLLYSGFTTDGKSGHAINIDGYNNKNGLFHFNFGWGGGGDGWYSLDLESGVNGFCIWQEIVYGITPLNPNVLAEIVCDTTLYRRVSNPVSIAITNNGTVPVNGFSLFLQTTEKKPSTNSTALASNTKTFIAPGETVEVPFELKPTLARGYWLYVTDNSRNELAHTHVTVLDPEPSFTFQGFDVSASTDTVMVGNEVFRKLNNTDVTLSATMSNAADATPGQPSIHFVIEKWNPETGELKSYKTKSITSESVLAGETKTINHTFTKITADCYLVARISLEEEWQTASTDTVVRFYVSKPTLAVESNTDGCAVLTGEWDPTVFASLAADETVSVWDLRGVTGVKTLPAAGNPNALFLVNTPVKGVNVVYNGQCEDLRLTAGYDFAPLEPFHAANVQYAPEFEPGPYYTMILPFTCNRPSDYICRHIESVGKNYFTEATTVSRLEAGVPYMVMCNNSVNPLFKATNADVLCTTDTTVTAPFVGAFKSIRPYPLRTSGAKYILGLDPDIASSATQYFNNVDTNSVLTPFTFALSSDSKKIRATTEDSFEKAYRKLGIVISEAQLLYDTKHTMLRDTINARMLEVLANARSVWSTMEMEALEVTRLVKDIETFCTTYPLCGGVFTKPINCTALITNPSFESNTKTGWKTDSRAAIRSITNVATFAACCDGKFFLHNNNSGKSTAISQVVSGLIPGWYRLTAMVGTDKGGIVRLFAGNDTIEVPAAELGKYYLTEAVIDSIWVDESGQLPIGVAGSDIWYKCDHFQLWFLGDPSYVPTSIHTPMMEAEEPQPMIAPKGLFDLQGRPLADPADMVPGVIYIYNGRKVMRTE